MVWNFRNFSMTMWYDDQHQLVHPHHLFLVIVISIERTINVIWKDWCWLMLTLATFNISWCSCSFIWIASSVDFRWSFERFLIKWPKRPWPSDDDFAGDCLMLLLETFEESLRINEKNKRNELLWVMRRVSPVFVFRSNEFELEKHDVHWHFVSHTVRDCVERESL